MLLIFQCAILARSSAASGDLGGAHWVRIAAPQYSEEHHGKGSKEGRKANPPRNVVQDLNSVVILSSICTFTHSILLSCLTFCLNVYLLSVVPFTTQPPAYIQPCVSKTIKMSKHTPYSSHDQMSPPSPGHVDFLSEMSSWKSRQKQMGKTFTSTWRTSWLTLSPFFFS